MASSKRRARALVIGSVAVLATGGFADALAPDAGRDKPAHFGVQLAQSDQPASDSTAPESAPGGEPSEDEGPAVFEEAFLSDPAVLETGRGVWEGTCRSCHGASAYPGKAPKLRPKKYTPEFVFDRVTNGYRKMPAWKDVFTKEERMAVTAYVLSKKFSP